MVTRSRPFFRQLSSTALTTMPRTKAGIFFMRAAASSSQAIVAVDWAPYSIVRPGGFAPPDPPSPSLAGTPAPRSAPAEAKLVARDDKKNPLISTFDWTEDATKRILRVPAGFMRNKTQERIEELARERTATSIDLTLVEEGIEMGKKMMAEMIATYSPPTSTTAKHNLNEVSPLTARSASDEHR